MRYFVVNFNTTDFLKYKVLNFRTLDKFPYIVEVAFNLIHIDDDNDKFISQETGHDIMKLPEGVVVSKGALEFHGIDGRSGNDKRREMFTALLKDMVESDYVVGHNIEFTLTVLKAELMRYEIELPDILFLDSICTMKDTTEFVGIPSQFKEGEFKFPTLPELHEKLFGVRIEKPTSAKDSVEITSRCLIKLIEGGIVG
jgi:DNA polymerase-3 subunit alpha